MKEPVALALITTKEGMLLMTPRKDNSNSFGFIGGKLDEGETPHEALVREVYEESNILVRKSTLIDLRQYDGRTTYCYVIDEMSLYNEDISLQEHVDLFNNMQKVMHKPEAQLTYDVVDLCVNSESSYKDYNEDILRKLEGYYKWVK